MVLKKSLEKAEVRAGMPTGLDVAMLKCHFGAVK